MLYNEVYGYVGRPFNIKHSKTIIEQQSIEIYINHQIAPDECIILLPSR